MKKLEKKDLNKRKLTEPLMIGEKVLILAERIKKKDAPGKLYKPTTQNKNFFNKIRYLLLKKELKQYLMIGTIGQQKKNQIK